MRKTDTKFETKLGKEFAMTVKVRWNQKQIGSPYIIPKNEQTNLFFCLEKQQSNKNKTNSFVLLFVCFGRIYVAPICLRFYLTFRRSSIMAALKWCALGPCMYWSGWKSVKSIESSATIWKPFFTKKMRKRKLPLPFPHSSASLFWQHKMKYRYCQSLCNKVFC